MDFGTPSTLQKLALQHLVRNDLLTISVLKYLPRQFFPPLLEEADTQRKENTIKHLVEYWPYPCLHVGLLIHNPNLETFQVILDGLDTWLKRKYRPRLCTLQVVDLRNEHHASSDMQDRRDGRDTLVETMLKEQVLEGHSRYMRKYHLRVFSDLSFMSSLHEDKHQTHLLQWAKERKDFVHLCCEKLEIGVIEVSEFRNVFNFLQPEYIKELEMNTVGNLSKVEKFVPCISKMRNLQKLMLVRFFGTITYTPTEERKVTKIISLFSKLRCLQHITIDDVYFLTGHMDEFFGFLEASLLTLKITQCKFSQKDVKSFAQHWNYNKLKHLCLRGCTLTYLNIFPLKVFLKNVANTLQILDLEDCRMKDFQISILLPALTQCTQLTSINLYDNDIFMDVLKDFLHHTTTMSQLTTEMYPAPVEVYELGYVEVETFSQLCAELMGELMAVRQPKSVCFGSYSCYDCDRRYIYEKEVRLCECHD